MTVDDSDIVEILIIESDKKDFGRTKKMIQNSYQGDYNLKWAKTYENALKLLSTNIFHVCITEYNLDSAMTGVDLLHELMASEIETPIIMLTHEQNKDVDLAAMYAGAADYLIKSNTTEELLERAIRYAIERKNSELSRKILESKILARDNIMSVGCLAVGIAHEINNPLAGVMQSVQNMNRRLDPEREKNRILAETCGVDLNKVKSYMVKNGIIDFLDRIVISGNRISNIVTNILKFCGQNNLECKPTNIEKLIKDVLNNDKELLGLTETLGAENFQIKYDFDKTLIDINCIAEEIFSAISIIVENALYAMTKGQCNLTFTPESIRNSPLQERIHKKQSPLKYNNNNLFLKITTRKDCNTAIITIEDNGPGIKKELVKRVFEPFFTTTRTGRTGLGLAKAYYIITSTHNGTIDVESEEGIGTKFIIKLPIG